VVKLVGLLYRALHNGRQVLRVHVRAHHRLENLEEIGRIDEAVVVDVVYAKKN